jgi:hypothetical protein
MISICSNVVCRVIEAEGGLSPLVSILKCSDISGAIAEKVLVFHYLLLYVSSGKISNIK